jgi:hypothetical protein
MGVREGVEKNLMGSAPTAALVSCSLLGGFWGHRNGRRDGFAS